MNEFIVTLDVDWAPDFIVDDVASLLVGGRVASTWFVTHASPAVERLRERAEIVELGIHPNFLPGSTHGSTTAEVLSTVFSIVPEAVSTRSHAVYQHGPLLQHFARNTPLRLDSSIFLPGMPHIRPVRLTYAERTLVRVPFFWADDHELGSPSPAWSLEPMKRVPGLKVMAFHPVHVYFNFSDEHQYVAMKQAVPDLKVLTRDAAKPFVNPGPGVRTLFAELAGHMSEAGGSRRLKDLLAS